MAEASLERRTVSGAAWTIGTGIASRGLGLVGTIVLTHFMARSVIGEVSDASIAVLLANQFSTIGVGQYMIAKPASGREGAWHATVIHLSLGIVTLGACLIFAGSIGRWMKAPDLHHYLPGLALSVLFDRISFIPERVLARDMQFRRIGINRTVGELSYTFVSVPMAMMGFAGMAVVWANVVRSGLRLMLTMRAVPAIEWLRPHPLSIPLLRDMMRFGLPYSVASSANFASRRFDNALVSGLHGAEVVGMYNLAYNVADVPAVQVGEQISDVLLPSFAKMKPEERPRALVRATGMLALVVFPLAIGLGAIADTVVRVLLRPEWHDVAPMLAILSILSVVRPVGWTISSYISTRDRTRLLAFLEIGKLFALVALIGTIGRISPLWACVAVGIAFTLHALASLWAVHEIDDISILELVNQNVGPLLACLPLVGAVWGVRHTLGTLPAVRPWMLLLLEIAVGAVAYVAAAWLFAKPLAREFIRLVRRR